MRVLRRGMSGPDVRQWQEFLSRQGFGIGTADGSFGERTFQATAEFQRRNGLGDDGVVGPGTLGKAKELGFVEPEDTGGGTTAGGPTGAAGSLTEQALAQIMPNLKAAKRAEFFPFLTRAMEEFQINTPARQAAFLAQLAHESAEFRFMEEIWGPTPAQRRYEGRRDLGNTQTGDGFRFKGRGPIQITGRSNYKRYGDMLGVDLISNPQLAATPEVGFRIAGVYWQRNNINAPADRQDIVTVTKLINGGTNGLEDRRRYYERAKGVLGVSARTRSVGGGGATRGGGEAPAEKVFSRGLDAAGETTPTAAERNASEAAAGAAKGGAGTASKKGAGKGAAKKSGAKKSATRKSAAKKSAGKKAAAKRAAGKSAAKKAGATKSAAKKAGARKSSTKKSATKKSATRKSASKKSAASRGGSKGASKKAAGKRGASKKGGAKKGARGRR